MKRSLIAGEYTSSRQESVSKHLKLGDGQESAITQNHQNQNQTQNQSRLMASEAAVFASPEGSSHLGPYQPATKEQAAANTLNRPVRVYADGIYDLFHAGHARQLQQCKKLFPNVYLIVGCCSDELTHSKKGKTVNNEWERYENLSHCRYVDEIVKDAPWTLDEAFLEKHRIDFVAHDDDPYTIGGSEDDIYKWIKDSGRFCATQRTEGVSTSDLITRIIKNYDGFIRRQLSRGIKPADLNVSKIKAATLKIDSKIDRIKEKGQEIMQNWHERADVWIERFIQFYQNRRAIEGREDEVDGEEGGPWSPLGFLRRNRNNNSSSDEQNTNDSS